MKRLYLDHFEELLGHFDYGYFYTVVVVVVVVNFITTIIAKSLI